MQQMRMCEAFAACGARFDCAPFVFRYTQNTAPMICSISMLLRSVSGGDDAQFAGMEQTADSRQAIALRVPAVAGLDR